MNQKLELTRYVAEQCQLPIDDDSIKHYLTQWWFNSRKKSLGGFRLTDEGFDRISEHIKRHRVIIDDPIKYTNKVIIWLDNYIDSPWYVTNDEIFVFSEKMAVQLVLFSGNIARYSEIKAARAGRKYRQNS
jgi:hypothetical protein